MAGLGGQIAMVCFRQNAIKRGRVLFSAFAETMPIRIPQKGPTTGPHPGWARKIAAKQSFVF
ncbi:MAG: hypothetical protein CM15mP55_1890 [Hyphomicrobiales bacterium]|nr:MAG: hypothetical protein CM15mP55_1890 [Hyphomicrobiales bacterium]